MKVPISEERSTSSLLRSMSRIGIQKNM